MIEHEVIGTGRLANSAILKRFEHLSLQVFCELKNSRTKGTSESLEKAVPVFLPPFRTSDVVTMN